MQRSWPLPSTAQVPKMVNEELLDACRDRLDAIRLCIHLSRLSHDTISRHFGIDRGNWSRMMTGHARFDERRVTELMQLCGNYAPMQWEARANGFALVPASQMQAVQHMVTAAQLVRVA